MAIPLGGVLSLRASCPIHLQAAVLEAIPPTQSPGGATVRARVERVFRGDVALGEVIAIQIRTVREGEEIAPGDFYYSWAHLQSSRYIEVYLKRLESGVILPTNSCSELLDALTDAPVLEAHTPAPLRRTIFERLAEWLGL
jgi:hypothetical protein